MKNKKESRPYSLWTYEELAALHKLRENGFTLEQIGAALGKSRSSIKRALQKDNVDKADNKVVARQNPHNIDWDLVAKIRKMWPHYTLKALNARFGFNVYSIVQNKSWVDPTYKPVVKGKGRR